MILSEKWQEICVKFQEGYNSVGSISDQGIFMTIEESVEEVMREWTIKVPQDVEEGLLLALKCFKAAKDIHDSFDELYVDDSINNLTGKAYFISSFEICQCWLIP